jgi:two-component system, cell cycle sensor histidine kinase and response regulator CckA
MERTSFEQWKPREVARLLALVEAERRYYQEMVAALPVALVVLSGDRTVVSANRAFRQIVNLRYEELRHKSIEQIVPSEELVERIRSAHVHGDIKPFFLNMGERRFRVAVAPIRSWEDEMEAETLLMLDDLSGGGPLAGPIPPPAPALDLARMPAVLWQADASTLAFTYVGGAAERLFGFPPQRWLAAPEFFSQRIHPDDRAEVMALYQSVAAAGGEATAEYRFVSASGASVWCRETIRVPAPAVDQEAGARIAAGVLTAIAQRRQLEAQSFTAGRVDALRGLSARLAHDLNNPLMIVTGYGEEVLNALPAGDPLRDDVAEMLAATSRVTELAAQLLGFTRSQAKPPARVSLRALLTGLAPRFADVEIEAPDVWAYADAEQLEEALLALTASLAGSPVKIVCETEAIAERIAPATLKPGVYARLLIQSSEAPAPDLLESFLPGKDPRHAAGPAAARAYLNVRQWGGDLLASSGGFALYLPHAEPGIAEPEPVVEEAEAPPEPVPPTILIVEDEPGIRGLVRKILRRERYEVLEAGSGEEALEVAAAHPGEIDLLLTDVMLPGINGRALAGALIEARPAMKVIYVSGYTDDESVRGGEFPPGSAFLPKPFTLGALVGKVREALPPQA